MIIIAILHGNEREVPVDKFYVLYSSRVACAVCTVRLVRMVPSKQDNSQHVPVRLAGNVLRTGIRYTGETLNQHNGPHHHIHSNTTARDNRYVCIYR
jgi:hypothetical protein